MKVEDLKGLVEYRLRWDRRDLDGCWVTVKMDPGRTDRVTNPKYFGPPETIRAGNYSNKVVWFTQEMIDAGAVLPHSCPTCGYDLKGAEFPATHESAGGETCPLRLNKYEE